MTNPDTVLILAAHGSSHPGARTALEGFAARVRSAAQASRVLLAYTAVSRTGGHHPSRYPGCGLEDVLAGLGGEGPLDLRVQSLHVIAGDEFDRMCETLAAFSTARGAGLAVSGPLLSGPGDAPGVARALLESFGTAEKSSAAGGSAPQACVLMGHGTTHDAQELYRILARELNGACARTRLGVLEAADPDDPLSIHAIARDLAASGVRAARLIPFLTVAGRHAHKDLAGDQPGSWKSVLLRHGITSMPDLAGLVEREAFARLWLERACASEG
ncbi:sirohydrochlorin cobaltochelatase [Fundidesulfovibrio terrae]|uniref:sirohydrochlorin cobaltochelatase n=1 Tax=Fundidesulfovibrio terrae TaxID=2922866 RepID=UPI001FAF6FAB|nr:sirohydrochlorin cobaltochelatase [Fundidesulfovibrio terrae]